MQVKRPRRVRKETQIQIVQVSPFFETIKQASNQSINQSSKQAISFQIDPFKMMTRVKIY